jgi:hypothetical protein
MFRRLARRKTVFLGYERNVRISYQVEGRDVIKSTGTICVVMALPPLRAKAASCVLLYREKVLSRDDEHYYAIFQSHDPIIDQKRSLAPESRQVNARLQLHIVQEM